MSEYGKQTEDFMTDAEALSNHNGVGGSCSESYRYTSSKRIGLNHNLSNTTAPRAALAQTAREDGDEMMSRIKFDVEGKLYTDFELQDLALDQVEKLKAAEARADALLSERDQWLARLQTQEYIERENAKLAKAARELAAQLATAQEVADAALIPCGTCGGSGFSKAGSGYDAVCDDCTGGYGGYATGEMVKQLAAQLEAVTDQNLQLSKKLDDEIIINTDARAKIDALKAQLEAVTANLKRALPALERELKEVGGCDHSVGICFCDFREAVSTVAQHAGEYRRYEWNKISVEDFEKMAPVDWREYTAETPLGQALDGMGDEVEP